MAERSQLQQELSSTSDKLMLLESELRLKSSRLEAAQQQLATEAEEHEAEQALLQKQLEQLKVCVGELNRDLCICQQHVFYRSLPCMAR